MTTRSGLSGPSSSARGAIEFIEHWQPRDPITYTFEMDTPPALSHPKVFADE